MENILDGPKDFFKNWLDIINFSGAVHGSQENVKNRIQLILFRSVHVENPLGPIFPFHLF